MRIKNQRGFSLVEILMVLILIAVLAAIAINAFVNFRTEARESALRANLRVLRSGITTQYAQMQLRCATNPGTFPPVLQINNNDITVGLGAPCAAGQVTVESERKIVQGSIPVPPMGNSATVLACGAPGDCTRGNGTACATAGATFTNQWCYNTATGEIWLDSATVAYEAY